MDTLDREKVRISTIIEWIPIVRDIIKKGGTWEQLAGICEPLSMFDDSFIQNPNLDSYITKASYWQEQLRILNNKKLQTKPENIDNYLYNYFKDVIRTQDKDRSQFKLIVDLSLILMDKVVLKIYNDTIKFHYKLNGNKLSLIGVEGNAMSNAAKDKEQLVEDPLTDDDIFINEYDEETRIGTLIYWEKMKCPDCSADFDFAKDNYGKLHYRNVLHHI